MPTTMPKPAPPKAPVNKPAGTTTRTYRRNEIWMVNADPTQPAIGNEIWSNRPALIVSGNVMNNHSGFAQIIYLSTATRKRSSPIHVLIPAPDGKGEAMALCEQIHTVDQSRLKRRMAQLPHEYSRDIDAALALSLSLNKNPDTNGLFYKWEEQVKLHGIDLATEIQALAGQTADQRVEALTRALALVTQERDAYQRLHEISQQIPEAMDEVHECITGQLPLL